MPSNSSRIRKEVLRAEAEERQAAHDKLSIQEKLDRLPKDGAKRERARLEALLALSKTQVKDIEKKVDPEKETQAEGKKSKKKNK